MVLLSVSVNGEHYISTDLKYEYLPEPVISRVSPSSGPETGGSRVYVSGRNLSSHGAIMCEFGSVSHRVVAVHKSETLVYCDSRDMNPEKSRCD